MKTVSILIALCSIANFVVAAPVDGPVPVAETKEIPAISLVSQDEHGITFAGQNGEYFWLPLTAYAALVGATVGSIIGGTTWWAKSSDDVAVADYSAVLAAAEKLAASDVPAAPEGSKELSVVATQGESILLADASGEWFWWPVGAATLLAGLVASGTAAGIATLKKHN